MKQVTFSSKEDASSYLAKYIIDRINQFAPTPSKPFVLGLPTGSSPEGVYGKLIEAYKEGKVSFKNVVTFNMDEYIGLKPSNQQSYHYFMFNKFFNHIDIPRENINILNGLANNIEEECHRYEAKIVLNGFTLSSRRNGTLVTRRKLSIQSFLDGSVQKYMKL